MVVPINLSSCNSLNIFECSRRLIVEIHFIDIHQNAFLLYMLHFIHKFPINFLIILILQLKNKIKHGLRSIFYQRYLYVMFFYFYNYIDRVSVFNLLISSSCAFSFIIYFLL